MPATKGLGTTGNAVGTVTPLDHKIAQTGLLTKTGAGTNLIRAGVFFDGVTTIVSGTANMSYDVARFTAALTRSAAAGTVLLANDGVQNVVTTAAPGSNSRIDIVYVWQREFTLDGTDSNPVIGVVQGTAAAVPVAPSLAAFPGALELSRITVPTGVTATNSGPTITQTAPFTATAGGVLVFRNPTERDAATVPVGTKGYVLSTDERSVRISGAWGQEGFGLVQTVYFTSSGSFVKADYPWLRAIRVHALGGAGGGGGCAATSSGQAADAGGGASGTYATSFITDIASLPASVTVTRGASGAGGTAGDNDGSAGGASSFGSLVSASGGGGGSGSSDTTTTSRNPGGFGSSTGTGDFVAGGGDGFNGLVVSGSAGRQGNGAAAPGPHGAGSRRRSGDGAGLAGASPGGGGTGGTLDASSSAVAGGAGGNGIVVVELFA